MYYILVVNHADLLLHGGPWAVEFGSYERRDVVEELKSYKTGGESNPMRILKIESARRSAVKKALDKLNKPIQKQLKNWFNDVNKKIRNKLNEEQ